MTQKLNQILVNFHRQLRAPKKIEASLSALASLIEQRNIPDNRQGLQEVKQYLQMLLLLAYPHLIAKNLRLCQQLQQQCEQLQLEPTPKKPFSGYSG